MSSLTKNTQVPCFLDHVTELVHLTIITILYKQTKMNRKLLNKSNCKSCKSCKASSCPCNPNLSEKDRYISLKIFPNSNFMQFIEFSLWHLQGSLCLYLLRQTMSNSHLQSWIGNHIGWFNKIDCQRYSKLGTFSWCCSRS